MSRARGRRTGSPDTRAAVLTGARDLFAQRGYAGTTIRAVAQRAGVDPALVHHYFGSKDRLFLAAMEVPVDPRDLLAPMVRRGPRGAGRRLVETFLAVWDDPQTQPALVALARRALEPGGDRLLRDGFLPAVIEPVVTELGVDRPAERTGVLASQVLGLVLARYVLRVEPVASWPTGQVAATYAPLFQRCLTGPLP